MMLESDDSMEVDIEVGNNKRAEEQLLRTSTDSLDRVRSCRGMPNLSWMVLCRS